VKISIDIFQLNLVGLKDEEYSGSRNKIIDSTKKAPTIDDEAKK